ncbi:NAD(P)H-dependent oxidoreductase [Alkaliflexus imshenetskii]|uniref:NAD(P)H-dependent oxidoreductase n=1 Tax=Alkaliflexus imshenetskii TaxID=286730 RepID=UPI00047BC632|nr:NAD(P)H-dependent oxidoreductase [Alkaliflexus imshenetskii]
MKEIHEAYAWRYATKRFDATRKLSKEQLDKLLSAAQMAPSSYGLQPFEIMVVEKDDLRKQLQEAAYGQPQLTEASHVIVFAANKKVHEALIDSFVQRVAKTRGQSTESLQDFRNMMVGSVSGKTEQERFQWAARQAYIALGFLLSTAAIEGIDACPMEGFNNAEFDKLLNLEQKGLHSVVMATVGFRSTDDKYAALSKVRKTVDELYTFYK